MRTALDMAQRLKQKSLRQIALEVAILNHAPVPQPVSLREIMKLFANVAKPEVPVNLAIDVKYPIDSPTLSPMFADFSWTDSGAKTFRYATRYRCRLSVGYGSGYADIGGEADLWTTYTETPFQIELNFDTDYKASVFAWNDWGQSEWAWHKFHSADNPNPPSQSPGQTPPPQPIINAYIYTSGTIEVDGNKFPPYAPIKIFEVDAHGNLSPLYNTQADKLGTFNVKINVEGCTGGNNNPLTVTATGDNGAHFSNQPTVQC